MEQEYDFNEAVICTYVDLDELIEHSGMTEIQRNTVDMLMQGYGLGDIAAIRGIHRQSVQDQLNRAIERIIAENNQRWAATQQKRMHSLTGCADRLTQQQNN